MRPMKKATVVSGLILILFLIAVCAFASLSATLGWKASTGSNVTGYKVYYGTSSGVYGTVIDAGNNVSQALSGLPDTGPVYFAVSAYNAVIEGDKSPELVAWSIKATADANCTITNPGGKLYGQNDSATYTITPAQGYSISDVKVDGASVGKASTYTFNAIAANHTISVTTAQKPAPPTNLILSKLMLLLLNS